MGVQVPSADGDTLIQIGAFALLNMLTKRGSFTAAHVAEHQSASKEKCAARAMEKVFRDSVRKVADAEQNNRRL